MESVESSENQKVQIMMGYFNPAFYLKSVGVIEIIVTILNLYLAFVKGEEGPFPDAMLSWCSDYYPQNLYFRLSFGGQAVLFMILFYVVYQYVNCLAEQMHYKKVPTSILYLSMLSQFMLSIGASTVEHDGVEDDPYHGVSSFAAFVLELISMVYLTEGMYRFWKKCPQYVSITSVIIKKILCYLLLAIIVGTLIFGIVKNITTYPKFSLVKEFVFMEIIGIIIMDAFFISQGYDFDKINFLITANPENIQDEDNKPIKQDQMPVPLLQIE